MPEILHNLPMIFIVGGMVIMVIELVVPGLVVVFFGAAAVIVGLAAWAGLIAGIEAMLVAWVLLSLILVLVLRRFALRFFPSKSGYRLVEDDVDAIGAVVEVVADIDERGSGGRIFFNGTSWPAISSKGTIPAGRHARILHRENISWVVEPVDDDVNSR